MDKHKCKVLIFDFDETLYYSHNMKDYYVNYILTTLQNLTDLTKEKALELMNKYGFTSNNGERVSFGKNCDKFGVTKQQWNNYRIDNFFQIDYSSAEIVDNSLLNDLSKLFNLYIVSNEILENLEYKAKMLNIDLSVFKKIYAPLKKDVLNYKSSKQEIYKQIIEEENCKPQEVFAIGDRYAVDVQPLIELGGTGLLVKRPSEISDFFLFNKGEEIDAKYAVSNFNGR